MIRTLAALPLAAALAGCGGAADGTEGARCGLPSDAVGRFVDLPDGSFEMGAFAEYAEEGPAMRLHVAAFAIQAHEVTNDQFAAFVAATGHVTAAEREGGAAVFVMPDRPGAGGWRYVRDANWRAPDGPGSSIEDRGEDPVVQVSLADARAYARWAGGRLPSEVEWEYAAVRGLPDPANPRSGALGAGGPARANVWQGIFPVRDEARDGHSGRAPVGCFAPGRDGLYDMIGNVWEWTDTPYGEARHAIKGGSFLCAENYCHRFRPAARQPLEDDFATNHVGFRIVRDPAG